MKAIRVNQFGEPNVLKLETVSDPQPGKGEVVVKIQAVGVNPVETYVRSGQYPMKPNLPYTPGSDAAGTVESVGPDVSSVKVGDRVYMYGSLTGAYAEKALCKVEQVHHLPPKVSFQQGAALGVPYGTAYRALFQRGQAKPSDVVLIHGASGGVGTAAVQFAVAAGLVVLGTAGTPDGREQILKQGAAKAFDHTIPAHIDEIQSFTGGRGVNVILEMLANVNLAKDLSLLAPGGRVVVIGSRGPIEIDPRMTMGKETSIIGMTLAAATPLELQQIHAAIEAGLKSGTLSPLVDEEHPLAEAAQAHVSVMGSGSRGKIVLTI